LKSGSIHSVKNKNKLTLNTRFTLTKKGLDVLKTTFEFGDYVKKPVKIKAVQLTQEMLDMNTPPGECYVKNGKFFLMTLEGVMNAKVGAWYVEGLDDDLWFIQDELFKKNYLKVNKDIPALCVVTDSNWGLKKIEDFKVGWTYLLEGMKGIKND
jgi:hypothetical protein